MIDDMIDIIPSAIFFAFSIISSFITSSCVTGIGNIEGDSCADAWDIIFCSN